MLFMIDYETLGNGADTVTVSMGVCGFNRTGIKTEKLFLFDILDQQRLGRTWTASTLAWWMKQKDEARAVFNEEKSPGKRLTLAEFFPEFEKFCTESLALEKEGWDQMKPVGNGANFDISILEDKYRRHHVMRDRGIPWKFWNVICYRTFNTLTDCKRLVARPHGTYHTALEDAKYQARCMIAWWDKQAQRKKAK